MEKIKCSDYTYKYDGKLLEGMSRDGGGVSIHSLNLKVGDIIVFIVDDSIIKGTITKIEEPFGEESYAEIDAIWVENEEFSICEMEWIGKL